MIRPIQIETVLGGFIVRVGCQTVVFRTREDLLHHLSAYLQHPEEVEAKFVASAENARFFPQGGGDLATANQANQITDRIRSAETGPDPRFYPGAVSAAGSGSPRADRY